MTPSHERDGRKDHYCCFEQENAPCGIKGRHRCCLCEKAAPAESTASESMIEACKRSSDSAKEMDAKWEKHLRMETVDPAEGTDICRAMRERIMNGMTAKKNLPDGAECLCGVRGGCAHKEVATSKPLLPDRVGSNNKGSDKRKREWADRIAKMLEYYGRSLRSHPNGIASFIDSHAESFAAYVDAVESRARREERETIVGVVARMKLWSKGNVEGTRQDILHRITSLGDIA